MRWTVTWLPSAERALVNLWLSSTDRGAVTASANQIDQALGNAPLTAGESRQGETRILVIPPLAVLFDVDPGDRMVTVWAVWRIS